MSREYTFYSIKCRPCGRTGRLEYWEDDWNRWDVSATGFRSVYFSPIAPKKAVAECLECGERDTIIDLDPS